MLRKLNVGPRRCTAANAGYVPHPRKARQWYAARDVPPC